MIFDKFSAAARASASSPSPAGATPPARPVVVPSPPRDPAALADLAMEIGSRPLVSTPAPTPQGWQPRTPYEAEGGPSPLDRGDDDDAPRRPSRL